MSSREWTRKYIYNCLYGVHHHQPPPPSSSSVLLRLMWYMANIYYQCTTIYLIHSALCTKDRKIEMAMMMVSMVHLFVHCHLSLDDSRILPFCSSILFNNFIDSTEYIHVQRIAMEMVEYIGLIFSILVWFVFDAMIPNNSVWAIFFLLRHIDRSMLLSFTYCSDCFCCRNFQLDHWRNIRFWTRETRRLDWIIHILPLPRPLLQILSIQMACQSFNPSTAYYRIVWIVFASIIVHVHWAIHPLAHRCHRMEFIHSFPKRIRQVDNGK